MSWNWDDEADDYAERRAAELEALDDDEPEADDADDDYWEPQEAFL